MKAEKPLTLEQRIDDLVKLSGGTCAYGLVTYSRAEADEAKRILASKRGKGARLIKILLQVDDSGPCVPA